MRRTWILVVLVALFVAGCSSNKNDNSNSAGASSAAASGDVTLVFPAMMNESGDVESMTAEVKEAGGTNITPNDDGSVSVTISQENRNKLLEKYQGEIASLIEGLHSDTNSSAIKDLSFDKDTFKEFNLTVDKAAYESSDGAEGLAIFALAMQGIMYQVYSGVDSADLKVTFNLIDESTGETFETSVFPEAQ